MPYNLCLFFKVEWSSKKYWTPCPDWRPSRTASSHRTKASATGQATPTKTTVNSTSTPPICIHLKLANQQHNLNHLQHQALHPNTTARRPAMLFILGKETCYSGNKDRNANVELDLESFKDRHFDGCLRMLWAMLVGLCIPCEVRQQQQQQ